MRKSQRVMERRKDLVMTNRMGVLMKMSSKHTYNKNHSKIRQNKR